jgi:hypothetical protein
MDPSKFNPMKNLFKFTDDEVAALQHVIQLSLELDVEGECPLGYKDILMDILNRIKSGATAD